MHFISQVPKKYCSHSPLMMALEKGQDGDKMVETLLELGSSVAFNKKVGVVMELDWKRKLNLIEIVWDQLSLCVLRL